MPATLDEELLRQISDFAPETLLASSTTSGPLIVLGDPAVDHPEAVTTPYRNPDQPLDHPMHYTWTVTPKQWYRVEGNALIAGRRSNGFMDIINLSTNQDTKWLKLVLTPREASETITGNFQRHPMPTNDSITARFPTVPLFSNRHLQPAILTAVHSQLRLLSEEDWVRTAIRRNNQNRFPGITVIAAIYDFKLYESDRPKPLMRNVLLNQHKKLSRQKSSRKTRRKSRRNLYSRNRRNGHSKNRSNNRRNGHSKNRRIRQRSSKGRRRSHRKKTQKKVKKKM